MPRQLKWYESIQGSTTLVSAAQASNDLLANLETANRVGATVTRIIGKMHFNTTVVTNLHSVHYGITLVNADALAAGSLPEADAVDDADWLYHSYAEFKSDSVPDMSQNAVVVFDVRSQRVIRAGQDRLLMIFDNSAGETLNRSHMIRTLVRLP